MTSEGGIMASEDGTLISEGGTLISEGGATFFRALLNIPMVYKTRVL